MTPDVALLLALSAVLALAVSCLVASWVGAGED